MRWGAKNLNGGEGEIYLGSGEFKSSFGGRGEDFGYVPTTYSSCVSSREQWFEHEL